VVNSKEAETGWAKPTRKEVSDMRAFFERRVPLSETVRAWTSSIEEGEKGCNAYSLAALLAEGIVAFPSSHERVLDFMEAVSKVADDALKAEEKAGKPSDGSKPRVSNLFYLTLHLRDALKLCKQANLQSLGYMLGITYHSH
jgi:hypothetical protein